MTALKQDAICLPASSIGRGYKGYSVSGVKLLKIKRGGALINPNLQGQVECKAAKRGVARYEDL